MNTTILLIATIVFVIFSSLKPNKDLKINFNSCVNLLIAFFISTYIIYYLFNALDFGFTLTYPQVMFIGLLTGKANLFDIAKKIKEQNDLKNSLNERNENE